MGGDAEKPYILAAMGGDAEKPYALPVDSDNQQIIRVINSDELKGFNVLETHDANEWFV